MLTLPITKDKIISCFGILWDSLFELNSFSAKDSQSAFFFKICKTAGKFISSSTVGHKSHDPCFRKKYVKVGVMTFVAYYEHLGVVLIIIRTLTVHFRRGSKTIRCDKGSDRSDKKKKC